MTDVMNSMGKSEKHYDENYSHTREYIPYMFHLYKILEQNLLCCQNHGSSWGRWAQGMIGKRHEKPSWG